MQLNQLFSISFRSFESLSSTRLDENSVEANKEQEVDENATCLGCECVVLFDQRDTHAPAAFARFHMFLSRVAIGEIFIACYRF